MLLVTALKLYWIELDSMELEPKGPVQTFMNLNLPASPKMCPEIEVLISTRTF